jgi:hypothetical protein
MALDYGGKHLSSDPNDIFYNYAGVRQMTVILGTDADAGAGSDGKLVRGTILSKDSTTGKYYIYNAEVGRTFDGILGIDVDVSTADQKAFMYESGEFLKDKLSAGSDYTIVVGKFDNILVKEGD